MYACLLRAFIAFISQRTRPKGMIDLTYSTVYEVHESLFGRYNAAIFYVGSEALVEGIKILISLVKDVLEIRSASFLG